MIIEFELRGSKGLHKGIFETTGMWLRYEIEADLMNIKGVDIHVSDGYKIFSHFSFSYYHTDKATCDQVYNKLISVFRGATNAEIEGVGYIRKISK